MKAGTGLTDDHQDDNNDGGDGDKDDGDGDEDDSDEDEMKMSPFLSHPCPSLPCLAKGQTFANLFDLFFKQCSEKLFHFTSAPVSAGSIYKKKVQSVCFLLQVGSWRKETEKCKTMAKEFFVGPTPAFAESET